MLRAPIVAVFVVLVALVPAYGQEKMDMGKEWCTDAHMKEMDSHVAKMSDAAKQKEAKSHLTMSKDAMKAKDTAGCVKHMEEAHKAMGM